MSHARIALLGVLVFLVARIAMYQHTMLQAAHAQTLRTTAIPIRPRVQRTAEVLAPVPQWHADVTVLDPGAESQVVHRASQPLVAGEQMGVTTRFRGGAPRLDLRMVAHPVSDGTARLEIQVDDEEETTRFSWRTAITLRRGESQDLTIDTAATRRIIRIALR